MYNSYNAASLSVIHFPARKLLSLQTNKLIKRYYEVQMSLVTVLTVLSNLARTELFINHVVYFIICLILSINL